MRAQATGELIIWLYRFLLITAISFALVIIIGNKYTEKFDIRQTESVILSEKIIDCIKDSGKAVSEVSIEECAGINSFNYYISANLNSFDSNFSKKIKIGNSDLKIQCDLLEKGTKFAKAPSCSDFSYLILIDGEKAKAELEINIGKHDKNLQ
jgi:hypothetical protein